MSEVGDSEIKLFGKTIGSTHEKGLLNITTSTTSTCVHHHDHPSSPISTTSNEYKIISEGEFTRSKQENELTGPTEDSFTEPETSSGISDGTRIQDADKETLSPKSVKNEGQSDEKALKKPDKLIPCPRCNSMETKFCYYNNYNVNQPRYFCKKCQRYWTAGGTMRNVPVGSGRRKNKSSSTSNYHHINVSDAFQLAQVEAVHGMHLPALRANGTVLTFGSDKPLCDSMVSALNLADKSQNSTANRFHGSEQTMSASCGGKEIGSDQSNGPCSTSSILEKAGTHDLTWKNFQAFHPQVPYFQGTPWPYSGYPVSFYPAAPYWGCTVASPWNVPWLSSDQSIDNSSPTSPTLGKHTRDGSMLNQSQPGRGDTVQEREAERSVLTPKTLRIHDPNEAAKSSIWSTLGIKNDKIDSVRGARLFKAFNHKADHRNHESDASLVLQANPAAMSRSLNFHESTQ